MATGMQFDRYFREYLERGLSGGTPRNGWSYKDDITVLGTYDLFCVTGDLFYRDAILRLTKDLARTTSTRSARPRPTSCSAG